MLQRVMTVAAESLRVLEHQLMDGSQIQDVRVGAWIETQTHSSWTVIKMDEY